MRPVGRERVSLFLSGESEVQILAGQIGNNVANGSPLLQHFFERSCVARRRNDDTEMGPAKSLQMPFSFPA